MENFITKLFDADDLGLIFGYTKRTIWEKIRKDPGSLPPTIAFSKKTRVLRWHPEVVTSWLRERSGLSDHSKTDTKRKVGRPRKSLKGIV